jgi:glycosyltransferase involved in cell wall biosynthesis
MNHWHIVTPEFPPDCGGVADYTSQVVEALRARGERVTVHAPSTLPDGFAPATLRHLDRTLEAEPAPRRILVQYVPNVMGRRGANHPFATWVARRAEVDDVRVMIHEPYLYWRWRPDHVAIAMAQRAMARTIVRSAARLYLSTEAWRPYLRRYAPARVAAAQALSIPSAIPHVDAAQDVRDIRSRLLGQQTRLIGHFGTYGDHIAPLVTTAARELLTSDPSLRLVCLGRGGREFASSLRTPDARTFVKIVAPDVTDAGDISRHLQACDVLLQPYPDGVTTRRTSMMAGLANACAVVTNQGPLTEPVWSATRPAELADGPNPGALAARVRALLDDDHARRDLAQRAQRVYRERFDLTLTIDALLSDVSALA